MSFDVYTPTRTFRLVNSTDFRTYTARQMTDLLKKVPFTRNGGDLRFRLPNRSAHSDQSGDRRRGLRAAEAVAAELGGTRPIGDGA